MAEPEQQQKAVAKEEAAKILQGLANAITWLTIAKVAAVIGEKVATHIRDMTLLRELEEITGGTFAGE